MARDNVQTSSGNNVTLISGHNVTLPTETYTPTRQGSSRTLGTFTTTRQGRSSISNVSALKNVALASGHNVTLASGNNVILPVVTYTPIRKGLSRVIAAQTNTRQGSSAVLGATILTTRQGSSRIGYDNFSGIKHRGVSNIYNSVVSTRRGESNIMRTHTPTRVGRSSIFQAFLPITRRGRSSIYNAVTGIRRRGRSRSEDTTLEGIVIYVGVDAPPDFTAEPDAFGTALPIAFSVPVPLSGTYTLHIVTRNRSRFGLESLNQQVQLITIDTNGDEVLVPMTPPTDAEVVTDVDDYFIVFANYAAYNTDPDPATAWRVYIKEGSAPVPGVDSPVLTSSNIGAVLQARIGPYPTGGTTYYFAVTLYRAADGAETTAATSSLTLDADPSTPASVPGGFG